MNTRDHIAALNQRHWEWSVDKGAGCTVPWLDLDRDLLCRYATGQLEDVPKSLCQMYPSCVLGDIAGKDVLCLASGGGQQSAVFGLLGACVTVLDLTESQLAGDRKAAAHYGYSLTALQGDMRDLSGLADASFDLVYQGNSMAWVPDAREIYAGVFRVLRPSGVYRVDFSNPATGFVECADWDGRGYLLTMPYAETARMEGPCANGGGGIQFRHHMGEIFNGLLEAGFSILQVEDAPEYFSDNPTARPGSWEHYLRYVGGFAIVVQKQ